MATDYLYINTRDELFKVDLDKMIYAMAEGNYVNMYFRNGQRIIICTSLQSLEQMILGVIAKNKRGVFIRIGRRYIVNNNYITHVNVLKQQLVLSDMDVVKPIILSVSKEALKTLKQAMVDNKKQ